MSARRIAKSRPERRSLYLANGLFGAAVATLAVVAVAGSAQAADFQVEINQTRALHLAAPAATILVGNPAIADVSIQGSELVYVLGKTYGKTNLIALDASGKQIAQLYLNVVAQSSSTVTVTRGSGQLTYNCTPRCERVVDPSDSKADFDQAVSQAAQTAAMGLGASANSSGGGGGESSGQ